MGIDTEIHPISKYRIAQRIGKPCIITYIIAPQLCRAGEKETVQCVPIAFVRSVATADYEEDCVVFVKVNNQVDLVGITRILSVESV